MSGRGEVFMKEYMLAMKCLHQMDLRLSMIGMSGCREIELLRKAVVAHGAETARDIFREDDDE